MSASYGQSDMERLERIYEKRGGRTPGIGDDIGLDFVAYEILVDVEREFQVAIDEAELSAERMRSTRDMLALIHNSRKGGPVIR